MNLNRYTTFYDICKNCGDVLIYDLDGNPTHIDKDCQNPEYGHTLTVVGPDY